MLLDMDCLYMYQTLADHKIKSDQVFNLDLDDLKTMGPPLGELKRFLQAISKDKEEREMKIKIAGEGQIVIILIFSKLKYFMYHKAFSGQ